MKKCKECKIEKPLNSYYQNGNNRYRPRCKKCEQLRNNKKFKPKKCEICSNEFMPVNSINKYCSFKCKNTGDIEKRSNKPKVKNCKFCNKEFQPYTSLDKFCSANCRVDNVKSKRTKNWGKEKCKKISGKNNPAYRNGMYSLGNKKTAIGERLYIKNRKELKEKIINEVGYVCCENCFTSNSLKWETHHIIFRSEKPLHKHLHDKENLIFLCIKCHNEFHKKKSIRNNIVENRKLNLLFGNDVLNK